MQPRQEKPCSDTANGVLIDAATKIYQSLPTIVNKQEKIETCKLAINLIEKAGQSSQQAEELKNEFICTMAIVMADVADELRDPNEQKGSLQTIEKRLSGLEAEVRELKQVTAKLSANPVTMFGAASSECRNTPAEADSIKEMARAAYH